MSEPSKKARKRQKLLLRTEKGYIDSSKAKREKTRVKQQDIAKSVDITNATKLFELNLDKLGPYRCNYYKNGRFLLLGGRKGHVAAFDWLTKDLVCEFNIRETVHAVQWLHIPGMFAVAQKDWVHIYDRDGVELNVVKNMYRITHLDFLEHHFLLVSASDKGYITWKDISVGKDVACFPVKSKVNGMTHNSHNGRIFCSHPNGTVSIWSPNHNRPVVSMLCHPSAVRDVTVSSDGKYFATIGIDKTVMIWDLRNNYKSLKRHHISQIPESIHFSQLNKLAVAGGNTVKIFEDATKTEQPLSPYLSHNVGNVISDVHFCNYEDVLGVGHQGGFSSLLVPGSGEPNFDSHEANPFMSKTQQRELEIKMLLDKIPSEMI